jgi:hypothetical protein
LADFLSPLPFELYSKLCEHPSKTGAISQVRVVVFYVVLTFSPAFFKGLLLLRAPTGFSLPPNRSRLHLTRRCRNPIRTDLPVFFFVSCLTNRRFIARFSVRPSPCLAGCLSPLAGP